MCFLSSRFPSTESQVPPGTLDSPVLGPSVGQPASAIRREGVLDAVPNAPPLPPRPAGAAVFPVFATACHICPKCWRSPSPPSRPRGAESLPHFCSWEWGSDSKARLAPPCGATQYALLGPPFRRVTVDRGAFLCRFRSYSDPASTQHREIACSRDPGPTRANVEALTWAAGPLSGRAGTVAGRVLCPSASRARAPGGHSRCP